MALVVVLEQHRPRPRWSRQRSWRPGWRSRWRSVQRGDRYLDGLRRRPGRSRPRHHRGRPPRCSSDRVPVRVVRVRGVRRDRRRRRVRAGEVDRARVIAFYGFAAGRLSGVPVSALIQGLAVAAIGGAIAFKASSISDQLTPASARPPQGGSRAACRPSGRPRRPASPPTRGDTSTAATPSPDLEGVAERPDQSRTPRPPAPALGRPPPLRRVEPGKLTSGATIPPAPARRNLTPANSPVAASRPTNSVSTTRSEPPVSRRSSAPRSCPSNPFSKRYTEAAGGAASSSGPRTL